MLNRWTMEKEIAIKALKDPAFKKRLLANPNDAIRDFMKHEKLDPAFLKGIKIHVREEKKNEWTISIPYLTEELQELSDTELGQLAAGGTSAPGAKPVAKAATPGALCSTAPAVCQSARTILGLSGC